MKNIVKTFRERGCANLFMAFLGFVIRKWQSLIEHCLVSYNYLLFGTNCTVSALVRYANVQNIVIGEKSYINGGLIAAGKQSKIVIGKNCLISYDVYIMTTTHHYIDAKLPIREQGSFEKDVIIGNDVWVGFGARILPGVTIGDGVVIGAGAVVTRDVSPYTVVAGVPARIVSKRS